MQRLFQTGRIQTTYLEVSMKRFTVLLICVIFAIFALIASCDLFVEQDSESSYNATIAWNSGLRANNYTDTILDNGFIYFFERPEGYDHVNIYTLTKLDAETGALIWRTHEFRNMLFCQPVIIEEYIYVFFEPHFIRSYHMETGELSATINVDLNNQNMDMEWNATGNQHYIYFGLSSRDYTNCFVRFDVNQIYRLQDPATIQDIPPAIIWQPETDGAIWAKPVVYKNTVYTGTFSGSYEFSEYKWPVELAGFDIDTKQMVFHKTLGIADDGQWYDNGVARNPLFIHDDILYYLSWSVSAYNLKTGDLIWRHRFTNTAPQDMYHATCSLQPIYYKGKLYYTGGEADTVEGDPFGGYRNINCIDASNGKLIWNAIAKDSESLDTNPIITHNKLYMAQYHGLWVYNLDNGKLIGVDRSFVGAGTGRNILYKDYMICVRYDSINDDAAKMVAVYVGK